MEVCFLDLLGLPLVDDDQVALVLSFLVVEAFLDLVDVGILGLPSVDDAQAALDLSYLVVVAFLVAHVLDLVGTLDLLDLP